MAARTEQMMEKTGRRPHVPTVMSRKKADELAKRNDTPLDVMVENMLFWRNKSVELESILMEKLDAIPRATGDAEVVGILSQVKEVGEHFLAARENAQRCAVDAAPYVHPRISAVHLKGSENAAAKLVQAKTPPHEALAAYLDSLRIVDIQVDDDSSTADLSEATEDVAS